MLTAGEYYVGDLCKVLDQSGYDWSDIMSDTNGLGIELEPSCYTRYLEYKGSKFFNSGTFEGNGVFSDQSGRTYTVNSACVGCFPLSVLPKGIETKGGHVVQFEEDFECGDCDLEGNIQIGHLVINTLPND